MTIQKKECDNPASKKPASQISSCPSNTFTTPGKTNTSLLDGPYSHYYMQKKHPEVFLDPSQFEDDIEFEIEREKEEKKGDIGWKQNRIVPKLA